MVKKPRLESVVVLVTSVASVGMTVAALLLPAQDQAGLAAAPEAAAVLGASAASRTPAARPPTPPIPPVAMTPRSIAAPAPRLCSLSLHHFVSRAGSRRARPQPLCDGRSAAPGAPGSSGGAAGGTLGPPPPTPATPAGSADRAEVHGGEKPRSEAACSTPCCMLDC